MTVKTSNRQSLLRKFGQSEISVLLVALIVLSVVTYLLKPVFLSQRNIMNTLRQISLSAICGFGLTLIILAGEIDLSVGSQQAVAGIVSVLVLNSTKSVLLAILAALLAGVVVGAINGLIVTKLKINSLIATLGTMAIWRGASMVYTQAVSIQSSVDAFQQLATGFIGPIPNAVVMAVVIFAAIYFLLNYTTFGRYIYVIGGNQDAARFAGLPVARVKMAVYIIGSVLTMFAGVLLASRMASAQPTAGTGLEMIVIASIILGGVSLSGGIGSIVGATIGMVILGVLQNALTLMDVSSFWQDISRGVVIILAVALDVLRKERVAKSLISDQKLAREEVK
ncbi:MAG: ABC transporter permease [Clostridiales bacterium]|nr:ABC transporter permease [Clostridiales bacterium]